MRSCFELLIWTSLGILHGTTCFAEEEVEEPFFCTLNRNKKIKENNSGVFLIKNVFDLVV